MTKLGKIVKIQLLIIILVISLLRGTMALAQENDNVSTNVEVEIGAADLNVSTWATKGGIFSLLNNLQYTIRYLVTWNPLVKTKMELTKANESLILAKVELVKNQENTQALGNFKKALERYDQEMSKISKRANTFKKKASQNSKLNLILDQYTDSQLKQQLLLDKLVNQAPSSQKTGVKKIKENSLDDFAYVLNQWEDEDKIDERLIRIMTNQKDYQYKQLKELEILDTLEKRISPSAKESIKKTQTITLYQFSQKLENLSTEEVTKFNNIIKNLKVEDKIQSYLTKKIEELQLPEELRKNKIKTQKTTFINNSGRISEMKGLEVKELIPQAKNAEIKVITESIPSLKPNDVIGDVTATLPTFTLPATASQTNYQTETSITQDDTKINKLNETITKPTVLESKAETTSISKIPLQPSITPQIIISPESPVKTKTTTSDSSNSPTQPNFSPKTKDLQLQPESVTEPKNEVKPEVNLEPKLEVEIKPPVTKEDKEAVVD